MAAVSRRGVLLGGAGVLLAACSAPGRSPIVSGPSAVVPPSAAAPLDKPVTVQRMRSAARGTDVDLLLVAPTGVPAKGLPVCLALHGRGANARTFLDLGLPAALDEAVASGVPPFAVAAVDGDHYWSDVGTGDDPQRMLSQEVPGWLQQRQLRPAAAVLGISMGGFGALRFARDHHELKAVAVCSAALFVSWSDAKSRKVFADREQWEANEPLLHTDELRGLSTGVWCGTEDPFAGADRKLIKAVQPEVAKLSEGGHNDQFWRGVLPDVLKFVGENLAAT
ncbi:alpha/beta hydrolase [Amycolatopsis sp. H20-H5]|uniref:alpha/beta hydrolase n=1 Tax=Amycolatopsis sp. H20-H5 TaxID=3046309 RepID=UPI002DBC345E|nr:alpha/beta hydrolase-fold protein [Amycolatopsis sp. H20-H5]MEC3977485.1 alpha/beta hydrolase-fold protein [Amycolatopsis sp. H20-H5]